ncbi:hypothetical protein EDD76_107104 [Kineothrix alysoides]|uniref:Acetyltransferase (GNAT) family protein n=1 Tax=Kineothrix alysoides TaxID=1469948 RepID=A0A4R1QVJ8_9FIRM|nr:hypothetical protein [Kineothrix alysoides]TCL57989.1 hypothetical protein EDD76_107104 [Kineothrix alysoides]
MLMERVNEKHVEEALVLALEEYNAQRNKTKALPEIDFKDRLRELLSNLFRRKYGVVAKEEGKVVGYLAFEGPWDGFFGNCKGAFRRLAEVLFPAAIEESFHHNYCRRQLNYW